MDSTPNSVSSLEDSEFLEHYDLLKKIGVVDQINELKIDIRYLREIIEESFDIFNKTEVDSLIEFLTSRLLDKFIPSFLVFVFRAESHTSDLEIVSYQNMKRVVSPLTVTSLAAYTDFFSRFPRPISFSLLEHKLDNKNATEALKPALPEILVPIMSPGGLHGIIVIGKKMLDEEYSNREIAYMNRLMQFASISLQNIIHYTSASTDTKTKLYNHSFFQKRLEDEMIRNQRYGRPFSLLVCDLDHFKDVNDTYGHVAGDKVLYDIARILEATTRRVDTVARYGGEEFLVLLPETDRFSAWIAAERIRKAIEAHEVFYDGKNIKVSVSVGGVHQIGRGDSNAIQVLEHADMALYWAKNHGRNRTAFYKPGLYFMGKFYYGGSSLVGHL